MSVNSSTGQAGSSEQPTASSSGTTPLVKIDLVTVFDLHHCLELTERDIKRHLPEPKKDNRHSKNHSQSRGHTVQPTAPRMNRHGVEVHDNGLPLEGFQGAVEVGKILPAIYCFTAATHIWIDEGKSRSNPKWKKKLELRRWEEINDDRPGAMNFDQASSIFSEIGSEALVGIRIWMNLNNDGSDWSLNCILRCWDQVAVRKENPSPFEVSIIDGIPLVDLSKIGFTSG